MNRRLLVGWLLTVAALALMLYMCALPGDLPADTSDGPGIEGTYTVNGVDPAGGEYSGTVVIAALDDASGFDVEWIVTGGIQRGTGHLTGDAFEVEWQAVASAGGGQQGTARYTVEPDGRLVGTRTVDGVDAVGTEEINPDP